MRSKIHVCVYPVMGRMRKDAKDHHLNRLQKFIRSSLITD